MQWRHFYWPSGRSSDDTNTSEISPFLSLSPSLPLQSTPGTTPLPPPTYAAEQAVVLIEAPASNDIIRSDQLVIHWNLALASVDVKREWEEHQHGRSACIQIQSNQMHPPRIVRQNNCVYDPHPIVHNLAPGNYTLTMWLVKLDGKEKGGVPGSTMLLLTTPTSVNFQVASFLLQETAVLTTANEVIGAALQAEWPVDVQLRRELTGTGYGSTLGKVINDPDYKSEWENVLRAAMHGRHLPLVAQVPFDIQWHVVKNASIHHVGELRTLNERTWNHDYDGATHRCLRVKENYQRIYQTHCDVVQGGEEKVEGKTASRRLLDASGNPTHSASVLAMLPHVSSLSNILVAVGSRWSDLTLWDGNHRALGYYGAVSNGERKVSLSSIPGENMEGSTCFCLLTQGSRT